MMKIQKFDANAITAISDTTNVRETFKSIGFDVLVSPCGPPQAAPDTIIGDWLRSAPDNSFIPGMAEVV